MLSLIRNFTTPFLFFVLFTNPLRIYAQNDSLEVLDDIVITGTMNPVKISESPIHIDIFSSKFLNQNPTSHLFDALQLVNGVRPQVNCNICATGDIHINGLEGPYTMILIDGMPIVSSLASVYGLMGIPNSIIERLEIVKGPASSLYGSEAMGGIINIITKKNIPSFSNIDIWTNTWSEINLDFSNSRNLNSNTNLVTTFNAFTNPIKFDKNNDGFTDIPIQNRYSIFQRIAIKGSDDKLFQISWRGLIEDRWGGEMDWNDNYWGGNEIYGESIKTKRLELLSSYDFPTRIPLKIQTSSVLHNQNSAYGDVIFKAKESLLFGQLLWQPKWKRHNFLLGSALRYTHYDDNTVVTEVLKQDSLMISKPMITVLPGMFLQDEIHLGNHVFLLGYRLDHHTKHSWIRSSRLSYMYNSKEWGQFRLGSGTGFRTVNIFTEEHAALTGARKVILEEDLLPEQSTNYNISWSNTWTPSSTQFLQSDFQLFYTLFSNQIQADYTKDFNSIYYGNSSGNSWNKGFSFNLSWRSVTGFSSRIGITYIDAAIRFYEKQEYTRPLLTEKWNINWSFESSFLKKRFNVNYTGNLVSPMMLPLASKWDPRPSQSPWWSIQNIQLRYSYSKRITFFTSVQNLLDWTPYKDVPFLIARASDPFDRKVTFIDNEAQRTIENPYGLTFDAGYVYAPNQGRRLQVGVNISW